LEPKNGGAERVFRREKEHKGCLGGREDPRTLKFISHPRKPQNLKDKREGKRKG